jgi:hypothetical protein
VKTARPGSTRTYGRTASVIETVQLPGFDLRHSYATGALKASVSPKVISGTYNRPGNRRGNRSRRAQRIVLTDDPDTAMRWRKTAPREHSGETSDHTTPDSDFASAEPLNMNMKES